MLLTNPNVDAILQTFQAHQSDHWLLMLDYDGTLTPIVDRPEDAQISNESLLLLKRLAHRPDTTVAIVSGRSVEQLQQFFISMAGEPILLSGLHGGQLFDLATHQTLLSPDPNYAKIIDALANILDKKVLESNWDGVIVENKTYSLALHTRMASTAAEAEAYHFFSRHLEETAVLQKGFRIQAGKKVMEIVPHTFHKNRAVDALIQRIQEKYDNISLFPIYFGDDETDESAFEAVNRQSGYSIRVASELTSTAAIQILSSVKEVFQLIEKLL
ncbi:MAG: trehalose-phosphatase [Vampirovibrio sp.]|nr:trehalose-phosphatase [Vampirovibrio sp.]